MGCRSVPFPWDRESQFRPEVVHDRVAEFRPCRLHRPLRDWPLAKSPSPLTHTQYYRPGLRRGSPPDDGFPGGVRGDHRTAAAIRALSQLSHCRQCPARTAQSPCPS